MPIVSKTVEVAADNPIAIMAIVADFETGPSQLRLDALISGFEDYFQTVYNPGLNPMQQGVRQTGAAV